MAIAPANLRRDLFRGSLEVLVLSLLTGGPRHGYALAQTLAVATGEPLGPGTLYPLLHRLEAQGWTASSASVDATTAKASSDKISKGQASGGQASGGPTSGGRRKRYTLTPAGEARLKAAATEWQAAIARMQGVVLPALRQTVQHPKSNTIDRAAT